VVDDYLKTNPGVKDLPPIGDGTPASQSTVRCHNHQPMVTPELFIGTQALPYFDPFAPTRQKLIVLISSRKRAY